MKNVNKSFTINNILYLLFGLVLLIFPEFITSFVSYIIGALVLAVGVIKLVSYYKTENKNVLSSMSLVFGIILCAGGLFIISSPAKFISIIPLLVGIYIIILGVNKYNEALIYKDTDEYINILISSLVLVVLGFIICFNPFKTVTLLLRIAGIILIINAIFDEANLILINKKSKNMVVKIIK